MSRCATWNPVVAKHSPAVVLLNLGALSGPHDLLTLTQELRDARILVLANRPTAAECTQLLSFGATGCLSKETEARDVINAIHLASRGMHVLPRSAPRAAASTGSAWRAAT